MFIDSCRAYLFQGYIVTLFCVDGNLYDFRVRSGCHASLDMSSVVRDCDTVSLLSVRLSSLLQGPVKLLFVCKTFFVLILDKINVCPMEKKKSIIYTLCIFFFSSGVGGFGAAADVMGTDHGVARCKHTQRRKHASSQQFPTHTHTTFIHINAHGYT